MKLIKRLGIVFGVLVVLLIAVGVILLMSIDAVAKAGIEKGASYSLGVPTTLDSADIGVFSGKFALHGLHVDNPEGFDEDHFLDLGKGEVSVSYATLRKPTIELPLFQLDDVSINLEKSSEGSNYGVILDNLKKFESGEKPKEDAPKSEKELVIQTLRINNVRVHVEFLPVGGLLTERQVVIDTIEMTDVGKDGGVKTSELMAVIMKAILASIADLGGDLIPGDMLGELQGGLEGLTDLGEMGIGVAVEGVQEIGALAEDAAELAGEAAEEVGEVAEDVAEEVGGALEDAAEGIGGLFGGEDDKEKDPP